MDLIYVKDIDKSLLYQGFTIRTSLLKYFMEKFKKLSIGENRKISIILNDKIYTDIQVINRNFNREKYPNHPEMYQVRYTPQHAFSQALRILFPEITNYVDSQLTLNKTLKIQGRKTSNIKIPENMRCSIAFYTTENPNVWEALPIYATEFDQLKNKIAQYPINEPDFEDLLLNDNTAHFTQESHIIKIRKLNKNVCDNLKKIYGYRCQICGQLITTPYGNEKKVIDAHHIDPFITSLNNNFNNIMILCPNHHRIIHAYNPTFKLKNKEFLYPNGYIEGLLLNLHL